MKYTNYLSLFSLIFLPFLLVAQNNPRNIELNWKTDTSRHSVPLDEFTSLLKPDGKTLTFVKSGSNFMDEQTSSLWSITGKCIEGYYKGRVLRSIPHGNHFAFSWFAFYPDSEIYEIE
ncbi:MAG: DUF3179 domain-containing (seleno)protein [Bacteroidota bacterium]|nr:DUF3179 domain-containing (seleno)protein [Bacteroidota bacterium]